MLDKSTGTFMTALDCLQIPEYDSFVSCEKVSTCFQGVTLSLLNVYAKQVLSPESNRAESWETVEASKGAKADILALASKGRGASRAVRATPVPV